MDDWFIPDFLADFSSRSIASWLRVNVFMGLDRFSLV